MSAPSADMICSRPSSCWGLVRPSLQSAPELRALDLPAVSKHVRWICGNFVRFLTSGDLDLFNSKFTYSCPGKTLCQFWFFYVYFCFRITSPYVTDRQTDRQTDGRTDGRARRIMRLTERRHNIIFFCRYTDISIDSYKLLAHSVLLMR